VTINGGLAHHEPELVYEAMAATLDAAVGQSKNN